MRNYAPYFSSGRVDLDAAPVKLWGELHQFYERPVGLGEALFRLRNSASLLFRFIARVIKPPLQGSQLPCFIATHAQRFVAKAPFAAEEMVDGQVCLSAEVFVTQSVPMLRRRTTTS